MKTLALTRLNVLGLARGKGLKPKHKLAFLAELANMGYRLSNPDKLDEVSDAFLLDYAHLMAALAKRKGGHVKYVPLFRNFPNETPEDGPYFIRRIMGYLANRLPDIEDVTILQNGTRVPNWLFNVELFGADPITQMQSAELYIAGVKGEAKKARDSHVEWTELTIAFDEELVDLLKGYLQHMLYAKSSIKQELHADLKKLLDFFGAEAIEADKLIFKENMAFVMAYFWNRKAYAEVAKLAQTPTDVLRLFASLTGTDVSLNDKIRFPKLNRSARKMILSVLEKAPSLAEDLLRYKGLWLEIGRYLHPGEYQKAFPKTAKAFDALRNGKRTSFHAKTELYLSIKEIDALLDHLNMRAGVFARKLHEILRSFPKDTEKILRKFAHKADRIPLKNLFVMRAYFATINQETYRTIVNKKGKMKILPNNAYKMLTKQQVTSVLLCLDKAIAQALGQRDSWKDQKVWIDPALINFPLPLQQRKASDGLVTLARGTRISFDPDKVLRLFVYWKEAVQRTDLDLSVIMFDEHFGYVEHVSYTNLKMLGIVHSGDIQSAPHGAAEFVDITLASLNPMVRYIAVQVYRYCGDTFEQMTDCHTGWMLRSQASSSVKTFDIKTVVNKYDLNGKSAYAIPMVVDLQSHEVILTDLYMTGRARHNNVEGTYGEVALVSRQIADFVNTRPVISDLAMAHAQARGAILADEKAEADISFGLKDCTYNATEIEKILSELI
jgi:stress response protein SCP2